jgi:flagellar protein FlbD
MIGLTRTSGEPCRLHPADIQRVETTPLTLVYLTDGTKYAVVEDVDEIVRRVRECRARALVSVFRLVHQVQEPSSAETPPPDGARVVPLRSRQER